MTISPSYPDLLQNGNPADATQVMANFYQIQNDVNANAAANGANSDITSLLGLTTPLGPSFGGTGKNNPGTIMVGGNFELDGAFTTAITITGNTAVTLPTSGTLSTLSGAEALSDKTITSSLIDSTPIGDTTPAAGAFSFLASGTPVSSYQLDVRQAGDLQAYFGSTGSNNTQIILDAANSGQEVDLTFLSAGFSKWSLLKDTSNNFLLYDRVNGVAFINAIPGGNLVLNSGSGVVSVNNIFSAAANGYAKEMGGIFHQWGSVTAPNGATGVSFPTGFPSGIFQVVVSIDAGSGSPTSSVWTSGISQSGFTVHNGNGATVTVRWMAVGD